MKKVVLLVCVMAVSGFASYCSMYVSSLNRMIEDYNRCVNRLNNLAPYLRTPDTDRRCEELKERIRQKEYQLNLCREQRNDDIAREFRSR